MCNGFMVLLKVMTCENEYFNLSLQQRQQQQQQQRMKEKSLQ